MTHTNVCMSSVHDGISVISASGINDQIEGSSSAHNSKHNPSLYPILTPKKSGLMTPLSESS